MRLEYEAAIRALVQEEGIDGGVVYEDPHVRLSDVLAVIDSWGRVPVVQETNEDAFWDIAREAVAEYIEHYWPTDEGQLTRLARAESIVNRIRSTGEPTDQDAGR
jgi:hypothetical protein